MNRSELLYTIIILSTCHLLLSCVMIYLTITHKDPAVRKSSFLWILSMVICILLIVLSYIDYRIAAGIEKIEKVKNYILEKI